MANYKKALRAEVIERIDFDGYETHDGHPYSPKTDDDKIIMLVNQAMQEVDFEFKRKGMMGGLSYWLSGLPSCIDLPIYYGQILEFAVKIGSIPANYTEKQGERVCQNFYNFMASNILQMYNKSVERSNKMMGENQTESK